MKTSDTDIFVQLNFLVELFITRDKRRILDIVRHMWNPIPRKHSSLDLISKGLM